MNAQPVLPECQHPQLSPEPCGSTAHREGSRSTHTIITSIVARGREIKLMERNEPYVSLLTVPACFSPPARSPLPAGGMKGCSEGCSAGVTPSGAGRGQQGWGSKEGWPETCVQGCGCNKSWGSSAMRCCPVWSQHCCMCVQEGKMHVLRTACLTSGPGGSRGHGGPKVKRCQHWLHTLQRATQDQMHPALHPGAERSLEPPQEHKASCSDAAHEHFSNFQ